jgi:hypothetical protein
MPNLYRLRQRVMAMKLEATSGAEETPTLAADAVKAEAISYVTNFPPVETNEHQDGLDTSDPLYGAGWGEVTFGVNFRGSATPGTSTPVNDSMLQSAGFARADLASAHSGTAQAGGANSITLAAGASGTDDLYNGMPIDLTGGPGSGEVNVITDYNGTSKVATVQRTWTVTPTAATTYSIPANSLYKTASQNLKTASIRVWDKNQATSVDALLNRFAGTFANLRFSLNPHDLLRGQASYRGKLAVAPANVADPGAATYTTLKPPVYNAAQTVLGTAFVQIGGFSIDLGNQVEQPDNTDSAFGYDEAQAVSRTITGEIVPRLALLSTLNVFSDWLAGTARAFSVRFGSVAGSRLLVYVPALLATAKRDADVRGYTHQGVPFKASGVDSNLYLCVF